jgi:hypothetical protein
VSQKKDIKDYSQRKLIINLAQQNPNDVVHYDGFSGTLLAYIMNPDSGKKVLVRVLLDSGANRTLLKFSDFKRAELSGHDVEMTLNIAGDQKIKTKAKETVFQLVSLKNDYVSPQVVATTMNEIGTPFPPLLINPKNYTHLLDLEFTEKYPITVPRPFGLLLAEPYYSAIMAAGQRTASDLSIPSARESKLGWFLRGSSGIKDLPHSFSVHDNDFNNLGNEPVFHQKVEEFDFGKFWSTEHIGISPEESDEKQLTDLEIQAESHQTMTANFDDEKKRWFCELPWKTTPPTNDQLGTNYSRANALLRKIHEKTLPEHKALVNDAYNEIHENGWSELVPIEEQFHTKHPTYVLSSRPVIKLERKTTKCRIVINASQADPQTKLTLNKFLNPGPNYLPHIAKVLLKQSMWEYCFSIDVSKMFFSVSLKKETDKDLVRYLWCDFGESIPKMYRFTVLPFGVVSSPFMAMWCLRETAKRFSSMYPKAVQMILETLYMDDISGGADTEGEAIELLHQILFILKEGGFNGHKVSGNTLTILNSVQKSQADPSEVINLLGLKIKQRENLILFNLDNKFENFKIEAPIITRRMIISLASQIFDTQGFVSPFIMLYKQLLPLLWIHKIDWDTNLIDLQSKDEHDELSPNPIAKKAVDIFRLWVSQIPLLKEISFPRWNGGPIRYLAVFGDASKMGMGVAAYTLCKSKNGFIVTRLIMSKTTLMPKMLRSGSLQGDAFTIARAEACAMLMATSLGQYISEVLHLDSKQIVYFTDSLLNLQRLQKGPDNLRPWEARRFRRMIENLKDSTFRFCPGNENPADLPSRGCDLLELKERLEFWTHGPNWLKYSPDKWPQQPVPPSDPDKLDLNKDEKEFEVFEQQEVQSYFAQKIADNDYSVMLLQDELKQKSDAQLQKRSQKLQHYDHLLNNISDWNKKLRILARIKRTAIKYRIFKESGVIQTATQMLKPFTLSELEASELDLLRRPQEISLFQEIKLLKKGPLEKATQLKKTSILRNLNAFWDEKMQLVRIRTRFELAESLPERIKFPFLLPKGNFSEQKILHVHSSRCHASQKQTHDIITNMYHVIGGYNHVKSIVRKCKTPRCRYIKLFSPRMSALPAFRIDAPSCFSHVGVDYLGPLQVFHYCKKGFERMNMKISEDQINSMVSRCEHNRAPKKVWIALFTCFHTRAIHLEIVDGCSTNEFIHAFSRFCSIRGRPKFFYSDNAKQFTSTDKFLKELFAHVDLNKVQNASFCGDGPIEWKFSTPEAPWTNSITERMIGLLKRQLRVAIQKEKLSMRSLQTVLLEIQKIINDRPLTTLRSNRESIVTITPNMLLHGRQLNELPLVEAKDWSKINFSEAFLLKKKILKTFWKSWMKDYVEELGINKKWTQPQKIDIRPSDVVILKPETLAKNSWNLAKIISIEYDKNHVPSHVMVKNSSGQIIKRTVRQIGLLEHHHDLELASLQSRAKPQSDGSSATATETDQEPLSSTVAVPTAAVLEHEPLEQRTLELDRPPVAKSLTAEAGVPGNVPAIRTDPVPLTSSANKTEVSSRKRRRHHPGFYKDLVEGTKKQKK